MRHGRTLTWAVISQLFDEKKLSSFVLSSSFARSLPQVDNFQDKGLRKVLFQAAAENCISMSNDVDHTSLEHCFQQG
jgi:hypothetical protein